MKLGVYTNLHADLSLEDCVNRLDGKDIEAVEIASGNLNGSSHCPVDDLLASNVTCRQYKQTVEAHGFELCALSCHSNVLHPDPEKQKRYLDIQHKSIRLAQKLGVATVNTFSGCPGDSDSGKYANWVASPWPDENQQLLNWQWQEKVIPFWQKEAQFAQEHGVRIGLEMFTGFVVYKPELLVKLRSAAGSNIGADLDPSHLIWQGIDPALAVEQLAGAIYHIHMKDVQINPLNKARNGVIDAKPFGDEINRPWTFRSVGYGHEVGLWKNFVTALRRAEYDGVLCIEQEDSLFSAAEGLDRSLELVRQLVVRDPQRLQWWPPTQSV